MHDLKFLSGQHLFRVCDRNDSWSKHANCAFIILSQCPRHDNYMHIFVCPNNVYCVSQRWEREQK